MSSPLERMADLFAEKEILPHVETLRAGGALPPRADRRSCPPGAHGPDDPRGVRRLLHDVVTYGIICEELARVDWVVASVVSVSNSLVAGSILRHGSDEQKQRWLPGIAEGEILTSACLTEPGGGTDLGNMRTTSRQGRRRLSADGTKVFISHAAHAGLFFVVATVDLERRSTRA